MKKIFYALFIMVLLPALSFGQSNDKAVFVNPNPGYYGNVIMKSVHAYDAAQNPAEQQKVFEMDQSGMNLPNKVADYKAHDYWHFPPISQGNTGTCWCFSTTSFFESEEHRLYNKDVKISEMFTVYWEYVEKVTRYVETRGNSRVEEGSEANAVPRIYSKYGCVPESVYNGLLPGQKFYDHSKLIAELQNYLAHVKASDDWNKSEIIATTKSILDHYMGTPPTEFEYDGVKYTPESFFKSLKLNMDDYVDVLSYMQKPFWQQVEYQVPDNWWHSKDYYNVPLKVYMDIINHAIENGYTIAIGGDVSEAGFSRKTNVALIPDFDIPANYINDEARQFRFSNGTTTDDHGMHIVGYMKDKSGKMWYLIKDSSSGSRNLDPNSPEFGYYFFSTPYMELKMMDMMVNKDALKPYLDKFKK
ncbi:MAG: peptidase C1 [Bacteroidales bacterium]|nr:peptidase C1 [Bacteroidales bacterium]